METNQTIKVRSRNSKTIPHNESYIIKEGKQYHAFQNFYGVTFMETCNSLKEAKNFIKSE